MKWHYFNSSFHPSIVPDLILSRSLVSKKNAFYFTNVTSELSSEKEIKKEINCIYIENAE